MCKYVYIEMYICKCFCSFIYLPIYLLIHVFLYLLLFIYWLIDLLFPECVARVPISRWGCGGWAVFTRRCAAVHNRSGEVAMAVSMGSSAKGVPFETFPHHIASFRVASVALCDIPTFFMTCQKSFCVARPIRLGRL